MIKELEQPYQQFLSTKKQFLDRINAASKEQQLFKPSEDSWSMVEVLEHILLSESGVLGFMKKYPPAQSAFKVNLKSRILYKLLAKLYKSGKKVKVPAKFLNPTGGKSLASLLEESQGNNEFLSGILKDFPEEKLKYSAFKHTVSGGMTIGNTIEFFENHIIHHSHQLDRLEKHPNYPRK